MSSTTATSASSSSSSNGQRPAAIFTPLLSGKLPSQDDIDIWVQQHRTVVTAGTASLVSTIASFPFDSVKSRLQVKYYPSIWACGRAVLEEEGLAGFFRGVTIPLITITFVRTSSFSIYYNTKSALHTRGYAADSSKLSHIALSGLAGGFTSGVIISCGSAPFELVKVQRQLEYLIATQKGAAKKNAQQPAASSSSSSTTTTTTRYVPQSGFQAAREIMTNHGGIRGFYLGFRLHFLRDTSGTALYFGLYDTLREMVRRHTGEKAADVGGSSSRRIGNDSSANTGPPPRIFGMPTPPMPVLQFLTGSTAGILSWLAVYWIDFLKTNVQQRRLAEADSRITAWQVLNENPDQSVLQRITRLYRGIGISAVRSFISHGLTWTLIEQISERIDARERLRSGDGSASSSSASSSPSHLANDTSSSPDAPPSSATSRWR
ncbi:unnamed protein product [Tilletia controversa]|nr:unnamed protein product [Tilletia controversa]CAD6976043.1 unnamed protein product [Tilletia controversa]